LEVRAEATVVMPRLLMLVMGISEGMATMARLVDTVVMPRFRMAVILEDMAATLKFLTVAMVTSEVTGTLADTAATPRFPTAVKLVDMDMVGVTRDIMVVTKLVTRILEVMKGMVQSYLKDMDTAEILVEVTATL